MVVGEGEACAADVADRRDRVEAAGAIVPSIELAAVGHGNFAVTAGTDKRGFAHGFDLRIEK